MLAKYIPDFWTTDQLFKEKFVISSKNLKYVSYCFEMKYDGFVEEGDFELKSKAALAYYVNYRRD